MNLGRFFAELKRRNVYKVATAYVVVGWLLIQVATQTFPFFEVPNWAIRLVILLLVLGFPVAVIIAWAFELTPEGIKRTEDGTSAAPAKRSAGRTWIVVVVAAGLLSVAVFFLGRYTAGPLAHATADAEKSIAVLPFENRSEDKANAYLADGIQDEILTRLSKIDGLKVISRTSTQRYKSSPENLPEIGKQLGVAHVLEGSVQKAGDQVRVNVQLINAPTDAHLWAEVYDRKLADIFAVQSEIAETIAKALQVKLSSRDKQAVTNKPTHSSEAYDAYLRGLAVWNSIRSSPQDFEVIQRHLVRAVEIDPQFAIAWSLLSAIHTMIYAEYDRTSQRLEQAKGALDAAMRLQPDAGDTQFALGLYRYRGLADFNGALEAFQRARERSANRVAAIEFSAYVKRRQGKWDEALRLHAESLELDPRNPILLSEAALTYRALWRFDEARALLGRALAVEPDTPVLLVQLAEIHLAEGDTDAAAKLMERVPLDGINAALLTARARYWMYVREFGAAARAIRDVLAAPERLPGGLLPTYRMILGAVEKLGGNATAAQTELSRARDELSDLRARGDTASRIATELMLACAMLGDKACVDKIAAELQPEIKADHVNGPYLERLVAAAYAQLGDRDRAIATLERIARVPAEDSLTPALLRLDPIWDPLRSDPRFQALTNEQR